MTAMTDEEVRAFLARNEWSSGIKADDQGLRFDDPEANTLELRFPETPLRATDSN
jgi:hypothetical protein